MEGIEMSSASTEIMEKVMATENQSLVKRPEEKGQNSSCCYIEKDDISADLSDVEKITTMGTIDDYDRYMPCPLKGLTNRELLEWEKMAYSVCQRMEKGISLYNGRYNMSDGNYKKFTQYNNFHDMIIDEMQRRVEWRSKHEEE